MENFWTSKKPINGLRHFVLLNRKKDNGHDTFHMVSVIDSEINFKITCEELKNSRNWIKGFQNLPKNESITEDYVRKKVLNKNIEINKIFISDDSLFNIS